MLPLIRCTVSPPCGHCFYCRSATNAHVVYEQVPPVASGTHAKRTSSRQVERKLKRRGKVP